MFGLFKSRFPKWVPGRELGRYEAKAFVSQRKIKLDWKFGDEALALFVPWIVQETIHYYTGLEKYVRDYTASITRYLDAPGSAVWEITDNVQPENYLLVGGVWLENGIGGTVGVIGGPVGPEVDGARAEVVKTLIRKTGDDARAIAAARHVIAFHEELGQESNYKKRGGRVVEAWRLANGGAPAK